MNSILKKTSATPSEEAVIMLRMVAIEVLFRMSMAYLVKNQQELRKGMRENPEGLRSEDVNMHDMKMTNILSGMHPRNEQNDFAGFVILEKWLGHDLLVNAIMIEAKKGSGRSGDHVFDYQLCEGEWDDFVQSEYLRNGTIPNREQTYNLTTNTRKKGKAKKKEIKKTGKYRLRDEILVKRNSSNHLSIQLFKRCGKSTKQITIGW